MTKRGSGAWKPGRKTRSGRAQRDLLRAAQELAERAAVQQTSSVSWYDADEEYDDPYSTDPAEVQCGICGDPVYRCYCNGG